MGATFDERRLAREAAMGDQRAWDGLVDRFGELVWSTARAWGLNPEQGAVNATIADTQGTATIVDTASSTRLMSTPACE